MAALDVEKQLNEACELVRAKGASTPRVGLVLGSGLGAFADTLKGAVRIPYRELPHMPAVAVSGHAGALHIGEVSGVEVACLQGRVHLYEGHGPDRVAFGVRLLAQLGCFAVLLTNAAGGIRTSFKPGTLMLVRDHLNLTGTSPLIGPNLDALGPRFPDMSRAYDPRLAKLARDASHDLGIRLEEGIYAGMHGPSYETPAEIRMLRTLGADAVGMSTVAEVIALRHMGARSAAISCITNMAAGMTAATLDHSEVEKTAAEIKDTFVALLSAWIERIASADWEPALSSRPSHGV
jgi:purine-nucleoside phosphorylase